MIDGQIKKTVLGVGHMTDAPGRRQRRFPPEMEWPVRRAMEKLLSEWGVGKEWIAICGGARGTDILFAELCLERGATVRIYLALSIEDFRKRSVRVAGTNWESRFDALLARC